MQACALAQQFPVSRLLTGLTGDSVQISLIFDGTASGFSNTKLEYQRYTDNTQLGDSATLPARPDQLNATRLDFLIPMSSLSGADQLSYLITLDDGRVKMPFGPRTWLTLAPLRAIENLNGQISKAKQDAQALTATIKAKQDIIDDLNNQNVLIRKRVRPAAINPANGDLKRVTNQAAVFQFTTPIPGLIQAQVRKEADDSPVDQAQTTPTFATNHKFTFRKDLSPDESYYVEAFVIDPASNTIVPATRIGKENPALHFSLAPTTNQTNATIKPITVGDDTIQLQVDVDQKSALRVDCYLVKNPDTRERELVASKGSVANDVFGIPSGDYVATQNFVFSGLLPERPYEFEVTGADQLGRGLAKMAVLAKSTAKKLDFDGPVQVTITPTNFTVTWASTVSNPSTDISGLFSVRFGAADPVVQLPIKPSGTKFTGVLDVAGLQKVVQAASTAAAAPTLTVSMDRAKEHLERSMVVTFNVPKDSQSAQKMAPAPDPSADTGVAKSLQNIGNGVSQPTKTKFSWQDLLAAGLGVVLKAI
jgi:hypothetical protein